MGSPFRLLRWLQRGSRRSLLMQSLDHREVLSILVCINRYTLKFPQLLLANILHQLISFNFGVRDKGDGCCLAVGSQSRLVGTPIFPLLALLLSFVFPWTTQVVDAADHLAGAISGAPGTLGSHSADRLSLAGTWHMRMDRHDVGEKEGWFKQEMKGIQSVKLPGSLSENGVGDPIKEIVQQVWNGKTTTNPVWNPMIRLDYRGAAWYQKVVEIPPSWAGKIVELSLERVCWQSTLWMDDRMIGQADSLTAPHRYDLGMLAPGPHRLTLRIDNREIYQLGCNTHSYHEASCTIFNGAIGELSLTARPAIFVRGTQVYADPATGVCDLRVSVANESGKATESTLSATVERDGSPSVLGQGE
jgi:hypothetical protein